jgi:hypothetical protein
VADSASKASRTADTADKVDKAGKATKGVDGVAGNVAGGVTQKAISGDGSSTARRNVGRYAGSGVSGAVAGAQAGAAAGGVGAVPGAVVGAAKGIGFEAGKDAISGISTITGGSPVAEPADKRLGAGGTGYERTSRQQDEGMGKKAAKVAAVGGTAAATPPAAALLVFMSFMAWLKSMFFSAMAMAANAANLIGIFLLNMAKAAWGFVSSPFMALGGMVAKGAGAVLGVTVGAIVAPATAVASATVVSLISATLLGGLFASLMDNPALIDDGQQANSNVCTVSSAGGGGGGGQQVPAGVEANAKTVYSVLATWGMPDENIAGILGNWSQESGIDPTSVESIFTEPYQIGTRKQAAWDGGFTHIPGQEHGGIGLGQWSNGRTPMLLDYAESKGLDWYTIETQLAFMVQGDNPGDVAVFKDMITTSQGSPAAAAAHFHDNWERSADNAQMMTERQADAEMWYAKMANWEVDETAGGGVEDIVGDLGVLVRDGARNILGMCDSGEASPVGLVDGGMDQAQAQALVDLYNQEGDAFLRGRYNGGGPGQCDGNYLQNCVSFSVYFANKYTSFQEYPSGNGIQTAYTIAERTGKQMSPTPTPYSIGSGPGTSAAGHTLVVLGVAGEKVIVGEAGYCSYEGRVRVTTVSALQADGWKFVDMSDALLQGDPGSGPITVASG